jgi:hypothetical protein
MGVSVRLSRNVRMYLPFWVAIPVWLLAAAVWLVIFTVLALGWLVIGAARLAARGAAAIRSR